MTALSYNLAHRGAVHTNAPMKHARDGARGRGWYRDARAAIEDFARDVGASPDDVADVLAITSPRVHVSRNVRITRTYFTTGELPGTMGSIREAVARWERGEGIRATSPKVANFAAALKGDPDAVVVDVWVCRSFMLDRHPTIREYKRVAGYVRSIATRLGWPPAETQAAIWTGVRSEYGYINSGDIAVALRSEVP